MFIWIGIDVGAAFAVVRKRAVEIEKALGCKFSCYTLPMHVSLKMPFEVKESQFAEIENSILQFFKMQKPLELSSPRMENAGTIVWVRYEQNARLCRMKDELNAMLREKHGIGMHEYDSDYLFHTTVFMFDKQNKNNEGYRRIKDVVLPKKVVLNKFIVGSSPNGKLGTFTVRSGVEL